MTTEDIMMDLMDLIDNGVKTEREVARIAVDSHGIDPQKVEEWLRDYHDDDWMRD